MKLVVLVIAVSAAVGVALVYVTLARIVLALWWPERASEGARRLARRPAVERARPLFRWIAPLWLALLPLWLLAEAVQRIALE